MSNTPRMYYGDKRPAWPTVYKWANPEGLVIWSDAPLDADSIKRAKLRLLDTNSKDSFLTAEQRAGLAPPKAAPVRLGLSNLPRSGGPKPEFTSSRAPKKSDPASSFLRPNAKATKRVTDDDWEIDQASYDKVFPRPVGLWGSSEGVEYRLPTQTEAKPTPPPPGMTQREWDYQQFLTWQGNPQRDEGADMSLYHGNNPGLMRRRDGRGSFEDADPVRRYLKGRGSIVGTLGSTLGAAAMRGEGMGDQEIIDELASSVVDPDQGFLDSLTHPSWALMDKRAAPFAGLLSGGAGMMEMATDVAHDAQRRGVGPALLGVGEGLVQSANVFEAGLDPVERLGRGVNAAAMIFGGAHAIKKGRGALTSAAMNSEGLYHGLRSMGLEPLVPEATVAHGTEGATIGLAASKAERKAMQATRRQVLLGGTNERGAAKMNARILEPQRLFFGEDDWRTNGRHTSEGERKARATGAILNVVPEVGVNADGTRLRGTYGGGRITVEEGAAPHHFDHELVHRIEDLIGLPAGTLGERFTPAQVAELIERARKVIGPRSDAAIEYYTRPDEIGRVLLADYMRDPGAYREGASPTLNALGDLFKGSGADLQRLNLGASDGMAPLEGSAKPRTNPRPSRSGKLAEGVGSPEDYYRDDAGTQVDGTTLGERFRGRSEDAIAGLRPRYAARNGESAATQVRRDLAARGISHEDLLYSGLDDYLRRAEGLGAEITRDEVLQRARADRPQISLFRLGDGAEGMDSATQFRADSLWDGSDDVTFPPGSYREIGANLRSETRSDLHPEGKLEARTEGHFSGVGGDGFPLGDNGLWHARYGDAVTTEGQRALLVDEVQSDAHQRTNPNTRGRAYESDQPALQAERGANEARLADLRRDLASASPERAQAIAAEIRRLENRVRASEASPTPDLPLKDDRRRVADAATTLAREAAVGGHDLVAWTSPEHHAARWPQAPRAPFETLYGRRLPEAFARLGEPFGVRPERVEIGGRTYEAMRLTPEMRESLMTESRKSVGSPEFGDESAPTARDNVIVPDELDRVAQKVIDKPRPLTLTEIKTFTEARRYLESDANSYARARNDAVELGDLEAASTAQALLDRTIERTELHTRAVNLSGTEQSAAFSALKGIRAIERNSLVDLVAEATTRKGERLDAKERSRLADLAEKLKRIEQLEKEANEREAQLGQLQLEIARSKKKGGRPAERIVSDERYQKALASMRNVNLGASLSGVETVAKLGDLAVVIGYHLEAGIRTAAEIAASIATQGQTVDEARIEGLIPQVEAALKKAKSEAAEARRLERLQSQYETEIQTGQATVRPARPPKEWSQEILDKRAEVKRLRAERDVVLAGFRTKTVGDKIQAVAGAGALINVPARTLDLAANATKLAGHLVMQPAHRAVAKVLGYDSLAGGARWNGAKRRAVFDGYLRAVKSESAIELAGGTPESISKYGAAHWGARLAGLTDAPFRELYTREHLFDKAYRDSLEGGATKPEAEAAGASAVRSPSESDLAAANEYAARSTYNNDNVASGIVSGIKSGIRTKMRSELAKQGLLVTVDSIFRFSKVISNVVAEGARASGVGVIEGALKQIEGRKGKLTDYDRREIVQAYAKGGIAPAMIAIGWALAKSGELQPEVDESSGRMYLDWGPLGQIGGPLTPIMLGASLYTIHGSGKIPAKKRWEMTGQTAIDLSLSQPMISNPARTLSGLTNPRTTAKTAAQGVSNYAIPAMVKQGAKVYDAATYEAISPEVRAMLTPDEIAALGGGEGRNKAADVARALFGEGRKVKTQGPADEFKKNVPVLRSQLKTRSERQRQGRRPF